jgi:hypothetical protein
VYIISIYLLLVSIAYSPFVTKETYSKNLESQLKDSFNKDTRPVGICSLSLQLASCGQHTTETQLSCKLHDKFMIIDGHQLSFITGKLIT